MSITNNELDELTLYLNESREHLVTIENDLLAIEADGADIDETLVNKVFRAAHSIKGGAGFFDLKMIQELAHKVENVLDMVRSRRMVPNPEVINILLIAFDKLRELITTHNQSNEADISELVVSLTGLTASFLPANQKTQVIQKVKINAPGGGVALEVSEFDLAQAKRREEYVYLIEIDLIHDVQRRGKTPWEAFQEYLATGRILECELNIDAVGDLDDEVSSQLPLDILFASVIDPSFIGSLFKDIPAERIIVIQNPEHPQPLLNDISPMEIPASIPVADSASPSLSSDDPGNIHRKKSSSEGENARTSLAEDTLRVRVDLLENLMNLAGELVLSRNQLQEAIHRGDARSLKTSGQRVNLVTTELQEAIMLTRMQPLSNILNKFPRVVRDLAREKNKQIDLEIYGREVELDKTLLEGLSEPLTHMVRNAVDHGIEDPQTRSEAGKNPTAKISLRAYHSAGQVVLEISDDGKGIDVERVIQAAISRGLITEEQLQIFSEKERLALIFLPGISTAEKITNTSGRGVGMDVVKTNLDRLGGKIDIESLIGRGTTFRITLPLTLAIIPSLLVSVQGERFAIPQANVKELILVSPDQVKNRMEMVGDAEVLVLRGKLVPVIRLANILGIERYFQSETAKEPFLDQRIRIADRRSRRSPASPDGNTKFSEISLMNDTERRQGAERRYHADSSIKIVVMTSGILEYGLVVDELHDSVEIVVRPLGRHLQKCREYAGAAILGDGQVALILDAVGLAGKANLTSLAGTFRAQELEKSQKTDQTSEAQSFLLFHNTPDEPCAMPLDLVERVEQIVTNQIENLGGRRAMQYRGTTLPLVKLKDTANVGELSGDLIVIVLNLTGRTIGLLGAEPVDVATPDNGIGETSLVVDSQTHRQNGIAGSMILDNRTILLIDVPELMASAGFEGMSSHANSNNDCSKKRGISFATSGKERITQNKTILLAEDSEFFRNQVKKYLECEGYTVIIAEDGQAAWELLQQNLDHVDMVITDIEMPRLNGLELARRIRSDPTLAELPIIALTSLADENDIQAGTQAGINAYEIKLDREKLMERTRLALSEIQEK